MTDSCTVRMHLMVFCVFFILGTAVAQEAAGTSVDDNHIQALLKKLEAESFEDRERAVDEIVRLGPSALVPLDSALKEAKDPDLKSRLSFCTRKIDAVTTGVLAYVSAADGDVYLYWPRSGTTLRRVDSKRTRIHRVSWILGVGLELRHAHIADAHADPLSGDYSAWRYAYSDFLESSALIDNYSALDIPPSSPRNMISDGPEYENEIKALTGTRFWKLHDVVSAPGKYIALTLSLKVRDDGGLGTSTYLYSPADRKLKKIGEQISNMTWSPSSGLLLGTDYGWPRANDKGVRCFDLATEEWKTVATKTAWDEVPRLSPDEKRVVFVRVVEEKKHIFLIDLDGKNEVDVAAGSAPLWSPASDAIAFKDPEGTLTLWYEKDRHVLPICKTGSFDWSRLKFPPRSPKK